MWLEPVLTHPKHDPIFFGPVSASEIFECLMVMEAFRCRLVKSHEWTPVVLRFPEIERLFSQFGRYNGPVPRVNPDDF